jgi:hypothetical protein
LTGPIAAVLAWEVASRGILRPSTEPVTNFN